MDQDLLRIVASMLAQNLTPSRADIAHAVDIGGAVVKALRLQADDPVVIRNLELESENKTLRETVAELQGRLAESTARLERIKNA